MSNLFYFTMYVHFPFLRQGFGSDTDKIGLNPDQILALLQSDLDPFFFLEGWIRIRFSGRPNPNQILPDPQLWLPSALMGILVLYLPWFVEAGNSINSDISNILLLGSSTCKITLYYSHVALLNWCVPNRICIIYENRVSR